MKIKKKMPLPEVLNIEDIFVGLETKLLSCIFSKKDNLKFAELSGNWNPLHISDNFARGKGFDKQLIYGILLASKFSYLLGMLLPGKNSICLAQTLNYHRPVLAGEKFYFKGKVLAKSNSTKVIEIKTELFDADKNLAVDGIAKVKFI